MTDAEKAELDAYRRLDLLRRMEEISREQWAAGWHSGLEHDLYLMTFEGVPAEYGIGAIAADKLAALKRLAELTRVWWVDAAPGERSAIALDEAERRFSKLIAEDERGSAVSMPIAEVKQLYQSATPSDWSSESIQPLLRGMPTRHVYRLRSQPLITLYFREERADWELRFGDTTVDFVLPPWAATQPIEA